MDIGSFISGAAIVIDDAYESQEGHLPDSDLIFQIVSSIEDNLDIPFYTMSQIPQGRKAENILHSASFILLDWKLWPNEAGEMLVAEGIEKNLAFLRKAKEYFVPVFIFTNESPEDVMAHLSNAGLYREDSDDVERNFIFIKQKADMNNPVAAIENWIGRNASVYVLKAWDAEFRKAKRDLFASMYGRYPDWPKVFWRSYKSDGVNPNSSVVSLINNNLLGRIKLNIFEESILGSGEINIDKDEIKSLISEASFISAENLSETEVRAGDLFRDAEDTDKYFLNIRPDCDCIPRSGSSDVDDVEVYCIEGVVMDDKKVREKYNKKYRNFMETVKESIVFAVQGGTIKFDFAELCVCKFSVMKSKRVGRLIHPYITRIQQRYALYLQRQGLPSIPEEAVVESDNLDSTNHDGKKGQGQK